MKRKGNRMAAVLGAVLFTIGMLAGCGTAAEMPSDNAGNTATNNVTAESNTTDNTDTELSGTIVLSGSTSMEKLANALCEGFMEKYPDVTATTEFTGSGAGIEAVIAGSCDIGNSSRKLQEEEIANGAVENIVAIDGIAVVVNPDNTVTSLTKEQLTSIYTGTVNNWSAVGGADVPIVVVGREAGSGTRGAFEEILGVEDACKYANELDSTGAIMAKVATIPGAIGYVSLDVADESVTVLALEGVEATADNIKAGNYLLSRPFIMATNGEIAKQSGLVRAWFGYVLGEEGQQIAAEVGLITVE